MDIPAGHVIYETFNNWSIFDDVKRKMWCLTFLTHSVHPRHHYAQQVCANVQRESEKKVDDILTKYKPIRKPFSLAG